MKPAHASFTKLIDCYFDTWSLFTQVLLTGPMFLYRQDGTTGQPEIPRHLQAAYCLLHLQPEVSLVEVRRHYREQAKLCHPDTGGQHVDFLALQQAYEDVVEYLQTV